MPNLIDICSGKWGWSQVFSERGWKCYGIELVDPGFIPEGCVWLKRDLLSIESLAQLAEELGIGKFDFGVASTPCENFSIFQLKNFYPNPPHPELGIKLFRKAEQLFVDARLPFVMENVRAAQQFLGDAVHHCGPFYLWGNAVPLLMPQGIKKGIAIGNGSKVKNMTTEEKRRYRKQFDAMQCGGKSKQRKQFTSEWATIPDYLANCVADYAGSFVCQSK